MEGRTLWRQVGDIFITDWVVVANQYKIELRKLYIYTANRPLRALYFDGFSAAKTMQGTLDLQNLLIYGKVDDEHQFNDLERGQLLCEWGKQFGIEGFVREEATFEVIVLNELIVQPAEVNVSCCGATSRMAFISLTLLISHYPWTSPTLAFVMCLMTLSGCLGLYGNKKAPSSLVLLPG